MQAFSVLYIDTVKRYVLRILHFMAGPVSAEALRNEKLSDIPRRSYPVKFFFKNFTLYLYKFNLKVVLLSFNANALCVTCSMHNEKKLNTCKLRFEL